MTNFNVRLPKDSALPDVLLRRIETLEQENEFLRNRLYGKDALMLSTINEPEVFAVSAEQEVMHIATSCKMKKDDRFGYHIITRMKSKVKQEIGYSYYISPSILENMNDIQIASYLENVYRLTINEFLQQICPIKT